MPDWTAFGAVAGLVLVLVLALARATTGAATGRGGVSDSVPPGPSRPEPVAPADGDVVEPAEGEVPPSEPGGRVRPDAGPSAEEGVVSGAEARPIVPSVSTPALLANVVVTHGAFAVVLVGAAALTSVPAAALGVSGSAWSTGAPAVAAGLGLGAALAGVNATLAANLDRFGVEHSEDLREALAPDGPVGWLALLVLILPMVALFEELLFRAVLVGAAGAATGVSAWVFAGLSSVAFAMGHGIQGRAGLVVTGLLGLVLAGAFVVTNSLLLVVVAHYVVNAVEFVWKEGLGGAGVGS